MDRNGTAYSRTSSAQHNHFQFVDFIFMFFFNNCYVIPLLSFLHFHFCNNVLIQSPLFEFSWKRDTSCTLSHVNSNCGRTIRHMYNFLARLSTVSSHAAITLSLPAFIGPPPVYPNLTQDPDNPSSQNLCIDFYIVTLHIQGGAGVSHSVEILSSEQGGRGGGFQPTLKIWSIPVDIENPF